MKIGIISDIHAYIEPLKRAISLLNDNGVSTIVCAGDLVDGGWDDDAVIDYIRSQKIISVRGNHDREAFTEQIGLGIEDDAESDFGDLLNAYRVQYLGTLPFSHQFNWEGLIVYVAHGAPWSDTDHIFPYVSEAVCRKIFEMTKADIVILGHTHIPMKLKMSDKWVFNAGALCGNRENLQRTCGILELPQAKFELFDVDTEKPVELGIIVIGG